MSRGEAGFADFGMGLRHLTAALLQHAFDTSAPVGPNAVSPLHHAALRVIATRATDADFDVTMLADAVGTSPRNLRHVFAQAGSWAKVELTAERVRRARAYLAQSVGNPQFTPAEIARLSGFRDVRALTRALAKHDGEAPPPRGGRQRRDDTTRT
ncbi:MULTISPECIES: helix-turn-helix domain-containing protein [unclassified Rathayibacter]|uniref:helix-turn-helix domain-containing protein n=1 Tax=unclassified Rathayibacter TaxID=2609250 RepID=UPI00188C34FF|nr:MULTISPECIES: helix-turn-helix domain-containing protein [unclassified Rathayibacter]MBF4461351.1 helix-turn-helix domain-containing protein [Rathayibacter sp. VKM Ac-2879]MBF4502762.1 helix-turn-helix domain-containing protein [Rathayibacter sp. VKM Ac-2878]